MSRQWAVARNQVGLKYNEVKIRSLFLLLTVIGISKKVSFCDNGGQCLAKA